MSNIDLQDLTEAILQVQKVQDGMMTLVLPEDIKYAELVLQAAKAYLEEHKKAQELINWSESYIVKPEES